MTSEFSKNRILNRIEYFFLTVLAIGFYILKILLITRVLFNRTSGFFNLFDKRVGDRKKFVFSHYKFLPICCHHFFSLTGPNNIKPAIMLHSQFQPAFFPNRFSYFILRNGLCIW